MHGRFLLLGVVALLVGAPSATAAWTQTDDAAPPRVGDVVTRSLTITVKGFLPYSDPKIIIRSAARKRSFGPVELLGSGELPDGGAALLVREGVDLSVRPGRLTLLRVRPDARITRLWSRAGTGDAALAVGPGGSIDIVRVASDARVHLTTGSVRRLTAERRLGLRVRGPYVTDVDMTRRGRDLVFAATTPSRTETAAITRSAKVLSSQRLLGGGRVELVTAADRVAAVVFDSGIEGEFGECVGDGDGGGVHLRAALLEPGTRRFSALQQLDATRSICEGRGRRVITAPDGTIAVLHHYQEFDEAPQPTAVSVSRPGRPFRQTTGLPVQQAVAAAVLDARGALHVAMFTADAPATGGGVLEARTLSADGSLGQPTRLGRSSLMGVSMSLDTAGRPRIFFRDLTRGPRIATLT